jgi:hypothetical protein
MSSPVREVPANVGDDVAGKSFVIHLKMNISIEAATIILISECEQPMTVL